MIEHEILIQPPAYTTKVKAASPREAIEAIVGEPTKTQAVQFGNVLTVEAIGEEHDVAGKCESCGVICFLTTWYEGSKPVQAGDPPYLDDPDTGIVTCLECAREERARRVECSLCLEGKLAASMEYRQASDDPHPSCQVPVCRECRRVS